MIFNTTYETWDQESMEIGDTDDRGFLEENEEYSFKEIIDKIRDGGFIHSSNYPIDESAWVSTESDIDYHTGEHTIESLHFQGPEKHGKYWLKALKYCLEG